MLEFLIFLSGKLPVTFPKSLADAPARKLGDFPDINNLAVYRDDTFVGYRYFDTYNGEPQFAFKHGLSYTTLEYSNLKLNKSTNGTVEATFTVTNTGKVIGGEISQLYVH